MGPTLYAFNHYEAINMDCCVIYQIVADRILKVAAQYQSFPNTQNLYICFLQMAFHIRTILVNFYISMPPSQEIRNENVNSIFFLFSLTLWSWLDMSTKKKCYIIAMNSIIIFISGHFQRHNHEIASGNCGNIKSKYRHYMLLPTSHRV